MPDKKTMAVLDDLKNSGFDINPILEQANRNPLLETKLNSTIGGGVLLRDEYTSYKSGKEEEIQTLQQQIRDLAASQDNLKNFEGNPELYASALEIIETQRQNLIDAGFERSDVENLSLKTEEQLKSVAAKGKELETKKEEDLKTMPNKDDNNGSKLSDHIPELNTVLANLAVGNIDSGIEIQYQIDRARGLGIEITREKIDLLKRNAVKGLEVGKEWDDIADETFGISAKQQEINEAAVNTRIEDAKRTAVAEALKDAGLSERVVNTRRTQGLAPMLNREVAARTETVEIEGSAGSKIVNGRKVPVDKDGNIEYYKIRGDKGSRMANAINYMNDLEQKRPELFEDVY